MKVAAILLLAGKSSRFDSAEMKQVYLLNNKPVFSYSLDTLSKNKNINDVIVVVNQQIKTDIENYLLQNKISATIIIGGETRSESVRNGLRTLSLIKNDIVVIHDGARPLIDDKNINDVIENTKESGCATTYIPEVDTIAKFENNKVIQFENRSQYVRIQTPQAFEYSLLKLAHESKNNESTDDCTLIKQLGRDVTLVLGSPKLHKITTIEDINYLEGLLK